MMFFMMSAMLGANSRIAWSATSGTLAIEVNKGWVVVRIAIGARLMERWMRIEAEVDEKLVVVMSYVYSCGSGVKKPGVGCFLYLKG